MLGLVREQLLDIPVRARAHQHGHHSDAFVVGLRLTGGPFFSAWRIGSSWPTYTSRGAPGWYVQTHSSRSDCPLRVVFSSTRFSPSFSAIFSHSNTQLLPGLAPALTPFTKSS